MPPPFVSFVTRVLISLGRVSATTVCALAFLVASPLIASEGERPVARDYSLVRALASPQTQDWAGADRKSAGCQSCHSDGEYRTMHASQAVVLGCTDCHGGNAAVRGD